MNELNDFVWMRQTTQKSIRIVRLNSMRIDGVQIFQIHTYVYIRQIETKREKHTHTHENEIYMYVFVYKRK